MAKTADTFEMICKKVHQVYCKYYKEIKGEEYWTKGDYNKLTEEGKEYDRQTVRAVLEQLRELLPEEKYIDLKGVDYMLGFNDCRRKILEVLK
jgi:hypothetical protein